MPIKAAAAAIKDPEEAGYVAKKVLGATVPYTYSPGLKILQELGLRTSAGVAGALEPPFAAARSGFKSSPGDVLRQMGEGAAAGVLGKAAPYGGDPATAVEDVYRRAGFTKSIMPAVGRAIYNINSKIPGGKEAQMLSLMGMSTVLGPKNSLRAMQGLDWLGGPGGAGLATEIAAGDAINQAAKITRFSAQNIRPLGFPEVAAPRSMERGISNIGDKLRVAPLIRPIVDTFSDMGLGTVQRKVVDPTTGKVINENAREGMRYLNQQRVGERGNLMHRFLSQIEGGQDAVESGVIASGKNKLQMAPAQWNKELIAREKVLEQVYENAQQTGKFTFDDYVTDGIITEKEADFLQRGQEFLEGMVPGSRVAAGAREARIYGASMRAVDRAQTAMARVEKIAEEGRQMLLHERVKYGGVDYAGNPLVRSDLAARIGLGERERVRRDLAKAISDADWAVRNFSRASSHKMKQVQFDRQNLWNYTLEELLGFTEQLTEGEMGKLGMTRFDRALLPVKSPYRVVVRGNQNSTFGARVFDRNGNEVWRGVDETSPIKAIEEARKRFPRENPEYDVQDRMWTSDRPIRGPRKSPIPQLRSATKEIADFPKYSMNYLPRYGSDELKNRMRQLQAFQKRGVSTSMGGVRVSAPTTTQEEARQLIRDSFIRRSSELNPSGHIEELEEPLQGLTKALETHAVRNADAISKTRWLDKVGQNFGVYTDDALRASELRQNGWIPIGKLKGSTSGMDDYLRGRMMNTYVPESVFNGLSTLDNVMKPREMQGFSGFLHKMLQAEKTYLTVPNPRFAIRNRTWEVLASYSRGNRNVANWVDADKLISGAYNGKKVPGFNLTGEELQSYLRREGVLGENLGLSAEVRPMTSKAIRAKNTMQIGLEKLRKPIDVMADINQSGEARARVAHWLWGVRDKKLDKLAARKEVATTIFDYDKDFYTMGEAQLKEWIPFYSWFRRVVPFTLRTAFERPGELAKIGAISTTINSMNGVSPEEMQFLGRAYMNSLGIILPDEKGQPPGTKRALNLQLGFGDPGQFMQMTPELSETAPGGALTGAIRGVASAFRPDVQALGAFIYAMSPSGEQYSGKIVKVPQVLLLLPKDVQERLNVTVVDGVPFGPSTLIPLTRFLEGGWGEAAGGLKSDNPRARAKFAAWLSGFSIDPEVTIEQNKMNEQLGEVARFKEKVKTMQGGMRRLNQAALQGQARRQAADTTRLVPLTRPSP